MTKRIYLAGPMTNIPYFNFPMFHKAAKELRDKGYEVFSPAEKDIEEFGDFSEQCPNGTHEELNKLPKSPTYRDCLRWDLNWILDYATAIALLPGWEQSSGVRVEKALADVLKLEVIYL